MQTVYCTSKRLLYRENNIIDLNQYRAALECAPVADETTGHSEKAAAAPLRRTRRSSVFTLSGWILDIMASLAVVVMTAVFTAVMLV